MYCAVQEAQYWCGAEIVLSSCMCVCVTCDSPLDPSSLLSGGHAGLFVVSGQGAQKGLPGTCPVAGMVEEVLEATEASADTGGHKGI